MLDRQQVHMYLGFFVFLNKTDQQLMIKLTDLSFRHYYTCMIQSMILS